VFLALRQNEIFKENLNLFPMWLAKKVYNIYHPTDPVAYRYILFTVLVIELLIFEICKDKNV